MQTYGPTIYCNCCCTLGQLKLRRRERWRQSYRERRYRDAGFFSPTTKLNTLANIFLRAGKRFMHDRYFRQALLIRRRRLLRRPNSRRAVSQFAQQSR